MGVFPATLRGMCPTHASTNESRATSGTGTARNGSPLAAGWAAMKANLLPGMLLWVVGVGVLVSYYYWSDARGFFNTIADWKTAGGVFYAIVSTALFAGFLPYLMQGLQRGRRANYRLSMLAFQVIFWGLKGIEIDFLYRGLATLLGDDNAVGVIASKVAIDQFIYVPLWAVPTMVIGTIWAQSDFDWRATRRRLRPGWFRREALPVMLSNWAIWTPTVALIYALPVALQLPIQNLVACLWVLMLMFMTGHSSTEVEHDAPPPA